MAPVARGLIHLCVCVYVCVYVCVCVCVYMCVGGIGVCGWVGVCIGVGVCRDPVSKGVRKAQRSYKCDSLPLLLLLLPLLLLLLLPHLWEVGDVVGGPVAALQVGRGVGRHHKACGRAG